MLMLEIYIGLCAVSFLILLAAFKNSPSGWQDEDGFHQLNEKEKLITFPLEKKAAGNYLAINFNSAHRQKLDRRRSGLQITLA